MKAFKIAGAAIAAVIVILALLLVIGIPSGFLTSAIQERVERETGYRLTIAGSTKISLWPTLNISLGDLTLQDPKDRDGSNRVKVGNVQADMTLSSVWSGHPHVSELIVTKPVVYVPLLRERTREVPSRQTKSSAEEDTVAIDRIKVIDGAVAFSNPRDHVESRIEGINAYATIGADRKIKLAGTGRTNESPLKFDATATLPASPIEHQTLPVEFDVEAPGLLTAPLSAKAEVRFASPVVMINTLTGSLGGGAFNGWASVELGSKPLVKVDLDFQRLDLNGARTTATSSPAQGWSDAPINLTGLNYVDAQVRISATELDIGGAQFAPAAVDAALAGGVLKASFSNLGAYEGQASGEVIVDASSGGASYAMHADLVNVRALPMLSSLAGFDKIDGKMQAKIAARSTGGSQHAIMANMAGTAFVAFQDGSIRGVNVAQMVRSLTSSTLNGWQQQQDQVTDLTQLSASFKADHGQAVTTDLNLVGPLVRVTGVGTIDLGTRMMGFRVEPKLVLTTEGQGRSNDPVGFGIPVMIEGPWSNPRIYPDMQGMLDDPDAAYAKLREMGKGLFGPNGAGLGGLLGSLGALTGGNTAGNNQGGTNNPGDPLGGNIGQALGGLLGKGFTNQSRSIPAPGMQQAAPEPQAPSQSRALTPQALTPQASTPQASTPQASPPEAGIPQASTPQNSAPPGSSQPSPQAQNDSAVQDSQPMNDVLRQLFNR
jgi:AsmA protein